MAEDDDECGSQQFEQDNEEEVNSLEVMDHGDRCGVNSILTSGVSGWEIERAYRPESPDSFVSGRYLFPQAPLCFSGLVGCDRDDCSGFGLGIGEMFLVDVSFDVQGRGCSVHGGIAAREAKRSDSSVDDDVRAYLGIGEFAERVVCGAGAGGVRADLDMQVNEVDCERTPGSRRVVAYNDMGTSAKGVQRCQRLLSGQYGNGNECVFFARGSFFGF